MSLDPTMVLRTSSDVVRLDFPGEDGPIFVLQLGDADQNIVIREGGELVFALLDLCDGSRSVHQLMTDLQDSFEADEDLWTIRFPEAVQALLAWRVIEVVGT
ncbi:MAG TPA: hypothetical protein VGP73_26610 [Thermoanaerobaculia bacterium]